MSKPENPIKAGHLAAFIRKGLRQRRLNALLRKRKAERSLPPHGASVQTERSGLLHLPVLLGRRLALRPSSTLKEDDFEYLGDTLDATEIEKTPLPWRTLTFVFFVFLPFLGILSYFLFEASDQYVSEARFAVRSLAEDQTYTDEAPSSLIGLAPAPQDAYIVTSFIHSQELLDRLREKMDYRILFTRPNSDWFFRFDPKDSEEEFLDYWKNHVRVYIDGPSKIITLQVRTFRPEESAGLAMLILEESEQLLNELSKRAREDLLAQFQKEVERTGKQYASALWGLSQFQQTFQRLSPEMKAKENATLLTGLIAQKLEIETRLFVMSRSGAEKSPSYPLLVSTQENLNAQIRRLTEELTGAGGASVAKSLLEYSQLEMDRFIAEKMYESARRNYDAALNEALRKSLYLVVFAPPTFPDESLYPKRIKTPLLVFLGLFAVWATLCLVWASIEDHKV